MRQVFILAFTSLFLFSCSQKQETPTEPKLDSQNSSSEISNVFQAEKFQVYTSANNTDLRLSQTDNGEFIDAQQALESEVSIFINPQKSFQKLLGIGGAITDASAEVFAKLPEDKQKELLEAYYSPSNGIGYSLARTSIHSCDFSSESFTYVSDEDKSLKSFNIDHDREFRIPMIKRATETAGGELMLYASPWSPPPFMKSNGDMLQGGKLLPEFYDSWALYYSKFIKAYEEEGMPIWGLTIQNEPMAVQRWESCIYTAEEERDFLKNHLGPRLEKEGLADRKIIVWDHNRDLITNRANLIFGDPEASKYAWGIGFHWYENWSGGEPMFENLSRVKEAYPDKQLVFTEGCNERFDNTKYEYWPNAERYGRSMINDFNNGTVAWTDWNILLDQTGGPNHVGNLCFAPVHADTTTGELKFTPSYYYIGHFSKFIRPDATRLSTATSRSQILSTSFQNNDGKIVVVVMNQGDNALSYKVILEGQSASIKIPARAMQTVIIE